MVSRTALTCNHYAARCTKIGTEILRQKNSEKEENAPDSARKRRNRVRFGCWRGWRRLGTDKTRWEKQRGRGRICLACRLGRFAAERHRRSLTPRHAPQANLRPHLVAKPYRTLTKNSATANAVALFLAGAEGLEPSARGFGVDVGTNHQERERAGVSRFLPQARKRAVLVWCCEVFWQAKAAVKLLLLEGPPPRGRTRIARRGPGQCRRLGRGFRPNPRQLCR